MKKYKIAVVVLTLVAASSLRGTNPDELERCRQTCSEAYKQCVQRDPNNYVLRRGCWHHYVDCRQKYGCPVRDPEADPPFNSVVEV